MFAPLPDDATITAALDGQWRSVVEIRGRLQCGQSKRLTDALQRLAKAGMIERSGADTSVPKRISRGARGRTISIELYRRCGSW